MMYTNTVPCGSYRAPGEPQAVFAVESHTDMIARAMGIDPYAFRLQNVVQEGEVSGTGQVFRHVRGAETLRRAAAAARWDTPKPGPRFGRGNGRKAGPSPWPGSRWTPRATSPSARPSPTPGWASIPWGARWSLRIWAS